MFPSQYKLLNVTGSFSIYFFISLYFLYDKTPKFLCLLPLCFFEGLAFFFAFTLKPPPLLLKISVLRWLVVWRWRFLRKFFLYYVFLPFLYFFVIFISPKSGLSAFLFFNYLSWACGAKGYLLIIIVLFKMSSDVNLRSW